MLDKIKQNSFWIFFVGAVCIPILRVIYYYIYGQSIASAHLDGHYFARQANLALSVVISLVIIVVYIIKRQKRILLWFSIPAIFIALVPLHRYIGTLFKCCPCCCTLHYVHQWNIVIVAIVATVFTVFLVAFIIGNQI